MLKIENLNFKYPTGDYLFKDFNLEINNGDKTALVGSNGSGKTTLFLLCCGILKPESGSIYVNNKKIEHNSFNPEIAYLFQSPDDQLFSPTIFDDVAFGPINMGKSKSEVQKLVLRALERVGGEDISDKPSFHLSGGEKRIASIASILSMSPEIMLFDEPVANLDYKHRRKVCQLIKKMDETIFISSHNSEFLLMTCNNVVVMDNGRIIRTGNIKEVFSDKEFMFSMGLEIPYSLFI